MKVEAFIIAWNVEDTIAFTIDHYKQVCDKITIYDNFSTDRTKEIAESMGAKVVTFGVNGLLDDGEYLKVKNHGWKTSKADYVIVCDVDEILNREKLGDAMSEGATIIRTQGFNMYSEDMPVDSWWNIQTGIPDNNYSKWICFSPKLKEIGYVYGCHVAKPVGDVRFSETVVPLFHYHNVGGSERMINRIASYRVRLSPLNLRWGLGSHYGNPNWPKEKIDEFENKKRREWKESLEKSKTLSEAISM